MPTLDFKGKRFTYGHHLTVPIRTLQTDAEKSLTDDNDPYLSYHFLKERKTDGVYGFHIHRTGSGNLRH